MGARKNVAIVMAFALAIFTVEVVNFAFVSWKAILSFPMLFLLINPENRQKMKSKSLVQFCLNCGHKIKAYQAKWKHFNGRIRTELCMRKGCECMHPLYMPLIQAATL